MPKPARGSLLRPCREHVNVWLTTQPSRFHHAIVTARADVTGWLQVSTCGRLAELHRPGRATARGQTAAQPHPELLDPQCPLPLRRTCTGTICIFRGHQLRNESRQAAGIIANRDKNASQTRAHDAIVI